MATHVAVLAGGSTVSAQAPKIDERPSCGACRIELRRIATVSGDVFGVTRISKISLGVSGATAVGPTYSRGEVSFQRNGVVSTIGRPGAGPGEIGSVWHVLVAAGDTLHVADSENGRITVYAPNGRYVRTIPLPARPGAIIPVDSGYIMQGLIRTPEAFGFAIHLVGYDGVVRKSFGSAPTNIDAQVAFFTADRVLARGVESTLWAVDPNTFRVEHLTETGSVARSFVRDPQWAAPFDPRKPNEGHSRVLGVRVVGDRMWMISLAPDPSWRVEAAAGEDGFYSITQMDRRFDTVVDVVNLKQGRIEASSRFDSYYSATVEGLIVRLSEDQRGVLHAVVLEPIMLEAKEDVPW